MKTVLVTGSEGFIGKNLVAALRLIESVQILEFTRKNNVDELDELIKKSDFIYHLAGVNRPQSDDEFKINNTDLTKKIVETLHDNNLATPLLITSSTQADLDNAYGKSKLAAEDIVFSWNAKSKSPIYVYRLPGVFGKWCKPNYNSVVATFCYNLTHNIDIQVSDPKKNITLVYIDDVIDSFLSHLNSPSKDIDFSAFQSIPQTFNITLGNLRERLENIKNIRTSLVVPNLSDLLNKYLYATYISYYETGDFGYNLAKNSDNRGWLAEFVKSETFGQIFVSNTKPGIIRGDHWHQTKIEKFFVVSGLAEITFRNKLNLSKDIISYTVSGDDAKVIDIPTGYVHAIKNIGNEDLVTIFWANEILNKDRPDTHYEKVEGDAL